MTGSYGECAVKRKATAGTYMAKGGMILGTIVLFLASFLFAGNTIGTIALILALGLIFVMAYTFSHFNVTWEYIFCDGQIDFDKICGGEKRKHILRIDLDNVEIMAPEKSHELDSFNQIQSLRVRDFSSLTDAKKYCIITTDGAERLKIIFEPSEDMVALARQKSPRKVRTD